MARKKKIVEEVKSVIEKPNQIEIKKEVIKDTISFVAYKNNFISYSIHDPSIYISSKLLKDFLNFLTKNISDNVTEYFFKISNETLLLDYTKDHEKNGEFAKVVYQIDHKNDIKVIAEQ